MFFARRVEAPSLARRLLVPRPVGGRDLERLCRMTTMDDVLRTRFKLTPTQVEMFADVVSGRSNADIARLRQRSIGTVAKQVARMLRKFGVTTRRELRALVRSDVFGLAPRSCARPSLRLPFLSEREREVWCRVVERGRSNKSIAAELGLSESTIAVLLCRARAKLNSHGRPSEDAGPILALR